MQRLLFTGIYTFDATKISIRWSGRPSTTIFTYVLTIMIPGDESHTSTIYRRNYGTQKARGLSARGGLDHRGTR